MEPRVRFDRWEKVLDAHERWWEHSLGRPLVSLAVIDTPEATARRVGPAPELPMLHFTGNHDDGIDPARIVDRWDWDLSRRRYVADGFPSVWPNFGAGTLAAFLGARMVHRDETIWFEPTTVVPPNELSLALDRENPVLRRVISIVEEAARFWTGTVQVGMSDLGGNLDVVQSFRPSELLATDLYDYPDDIKRLTWEVHEAWFEAFELISGACGASNPGYTAWAPILSRESYYMLQCDFCYMIGPAMFDEFVKPEIEASCRRLARPFYHLDGKGELPHLPSLLAIPELRGIQWVPGDGAPDIRHWPEVYRAVTEAGKLIQVFTGQSPAGLGILDVLADQIGSLDHVVVIGDVPAGAAEDEARRILDRYGVPW